MVFSLEALAAFHGDSLLLHYGDPASPQTVLIDGGPGQTYNKSLRPRLKELRQQLVDAGSLGAGDPLPLALAMVSHIDDDHIDGMLQLAEDTDGGLGLAGQASWVDAAEFWLNSFDDVTGATGGQTASIVPPSEHADQSTAVVASVAQGRALRSQVEVLGWPLNPAPAATDGLVQAPAAGGIAIDLDADTSLLIVAPQADDVERFRKEWAKQMEKIKAKETTPAEVASVLDKSVWNLSSIVCLVRQGDNTILLTGDANGDHVRAALTAAGLTDAGGKLHMNVLKLPHHGSERNVDQAFFDHLTADHYVISADGKYDNPDTPTLEYIVKSRGAATGDYTIHLTYKGNVGTLEQRLEQFMKDNPKVDVQTRPEAALSLSVHLGDAPFS